MSVPTSEYMSPTTAPRRAPALGLGHFPAIALLAGLGLLVCSVANALSRASLAPTSLIYWIGLLVIAVPIFYRLTSRGASFGERLALVILLGLTLYGVKVVRDSIFFNFPDEFVHAFNANQIAEHHHLFRFNPALPVTPRYPGLGSAASAVMSLTGMSSFGAGIFVIGAARLAFITALFLLFGRLSGSARAAGIGVAVYTGSSNFMFWGSQFSYESLALPLFVVVLAAFTERDAAPADRGWAWAIPIAIGICAVAVTHHITSYALAFLFVALAVLYRAMKLEKPNPWPFALLAVAIAVGWLLVVANSTVGYLFPVISDAVKAIFQTASGESAPRTLFHASANTIGVTPLPARGVALLAVAVLAGGIFLGVKPTWRRHRRDPLVLLLLLAAAGFFAALALRFAPAAWETGNRAGEFLFIGVAFVAASGARVLMRSRPWPRRPRALLAGALGIVLVGGAISGWPWDVQLGRPAHVTASGHDIESEPVALAEWAGSHLPGRRFAAPEADARLLLVPGGETAFGGQGPDIEDIVSQPKLETWQLPVLRDYQLPFVVADRRQISSDTLRGYYFQVPGQEGEEQLPPEVISKFDKIPVGRVWDSGQIVLFDLRDRP